MIIFDASYLVVYLHPHPAPAKDRNNKNVSQFRERVDYLITTLTGHDQVIGIPAPALSEVLVRSGAARGKYISTLSDTYRFEILDFGTRAAIEAAELIARIKDDNKSQPVTTWAKVKFDVQIVATAIAEAATQSKPTIYSDDRDIEQLAKRVNIPVIRICDLPLPPPPEEEGKKQAAFTASGQQHMFSKSEGDEREQKKDDQGKAT